MRFIAAALLMIICVSVGATTPTDALNDFANNPKKYLKDYTENPQEGGLIGQDINAIGTDAAKKSVTFQEMRWQYLKDSAKISGKTIDDAVFIQENASDIVHGKSNKYLDCNVKKDCKIEYAKDTTACVEQPDLGHPVCTTNTADGRCNDFDRSVAYGLCTHEKTRCLVKEGNVCVKYEQQYNCTNKSSECHTLRAKDCKEEGQEVCIDKTPDGMCLKYSKQYRCPLNKCEVEKRVECAGVDPCKNGVCPDSSGTSDDAATNSSSMKSGMERLATINDAAKNLPNNTGEGSAVLFSGQPMQCHYLPANINDCCKDSGWLGGVLGCSTEEKTLGIAKETGRVVTPGDTKFCAKKQRWTRRCLKWKKGYCTFQTKMARTIQEAARVQLGKGFGDGKNPNCRGLTPQEFAKLDFDKIDLGFLDKEIEDKFKLKEKEAIERDGNNKASELEQTGSRSHTQILGVAQ